MVILCNLCCPWTPFWGLVSGRDSHRRRQWHPTPVLLPGESHGWRSLVGCSPWGCEESDTTEQLHFHFSLSCIGGGNGNPLQRSCLENPRDGGAWWAAVYGVTQSWTQLKQLSSSSSRDNHKCILTKKNELPLFGYSWWYHWHLQRLNCFKRLGLILESLKLSI